jgi:hypothetical protein
MVQNKCAKTEFKSPGLDLPGDLVTHTLTFTLPRTVAASLIAQHLLNTQVLLLNTQVLLLNTQVLLLNTQVSLLNTQVSLLNTQVSLLNTQVLLLNTRAHASLIIPIKGPPSMTAAARQ